MKLFNTYDSHVHLLSTGLKSFFLDLSRITCKADLQSLAIDKKNFRNHWLMGFGWSEETWKDSKYDISKHTLDLIFPNHPVFFIKNDGHAAWLNSCAIREIDFFQSGDFPQSKGGVVYMSSDASYVEWACHTPANDPIGVITDYYKEKAYQQIPPYSMEQTQEALLAGVEVFNCAGFTHVRDMFCDTSQWEAFLSLKELLEVKWSLALEQNFSAETPDYFHKALKLALQAQKDIRQYRLDHVRVGGVKVYYDGALGSHGALLSEPYLLSGIDHYGVSLFDINTLREMIKEVWSYGLDLAVHAIGDEASHHVVRVVDELSGEDTQRKVHIEHAELVRPETLNIIKRNKNIICHFQPCHWLSDKKWLKNKISPQMMSYLFPWRKLEDQNNTFYFGSDSPIEKPSVQSNLLAVKDAERNGIQGVQKDPLVYHVHYDKEWTPNTYTVFEQNQVSELVFCGEPILLKNKGMGV